MSQVSPASRHRLRTPAAWLIIALLAAALAWLILRPPLAPIAVVSRQPILQTVVASGRVETPTRATLASALAGTVRQVHVDRGDSAEAGQPLLQLDDREARATLKQAEANLALTRQRLERLQRVARPLAHESLIQADIQRRQASRQWQHSEQLASAGHISIEQRDAAQDTRALRDSQWLAARLQAEALAPGGSDTRLAEQDVRHARAAVDLARTRLSLTTLYAPARGRILTRHADPGQVVQTSTPLFLFAPDVSPRVVVQIDEKNLRDVAQGQAAAITPDAYPTNTVPATVIRLAPSIDPERGAMEVELEVHDTQGLLRENMTVSVEIHVMQKDSALTLSALALHDADSGSPWVWRLDGGKARKTPVLTGARGNGVMEIVNGLTEGDIAIAAPTLDVTEGKRFREGERQP